MEQFLRYEFISCLLFGFYTVFAAINVLSLPETFGMSFLISKGKVEGVDNLLGLNC